MTGSPDAQATALGADALRAPFSWQPSYARATDRVCGGAAGAQIVSIQNQNPCESIETHTKRQNSLCLGEQPLRWYPEVGQSLGKSP